MSKTSFLKKKFIVFVAFLYFLPEFFLFAQPGGSNPSGGTIKNPIGYNSIAGLLTAILNFVVSLGAPVVTIAIIYSGFKFVAARGNSEKLQEARRNFLYVVIGAAIILGAYVLRAVITGTVSQIQSGGGL